MDNTTNTKSLIGFLVFLGIAAGAVALALNGKKDETPIPMAQDENPMSTSTTPVAPATTSVFSSSTAPTALTTFKNGTYSASGTYKSPAGLERVNVSVVLVNDIITDVTFKGLAENEISIKKQGEFQSGYKAQVIGKNIGTLTVSKVSGSSLTPVGFNDAIENIKDEAERM